MAAVLKADILTFVNKMQRENYAIADILDEINKTLKDLSRAAKWPDLYRSNVTADQSTLASGDSEISLPDGLRILDFIVINDGSNDGRPLKLISFEKWLNRREDQTSGAYDEPKRYARRGKKWYPDPIPDGAYTAKYWFWRYHPTVTAEDASLILFGDEFDPCLKYGVCAEVAKTHKRQEYIDIWEPRYIAEKAKMLPEEDTDITVAKYCDL
jgi:hypothetical protein